MSNAILKKETDGFIIIVDEKKSVNNIEYEIKKTYYADGKNIIKSNNVIFVYSGGINNIKMFIKSIDRISFINYKVDLHIELTIELME